MPFHPLKVYPLLVAVASVPYSLSYVTDLFAADGVPPFPLYVTVYVFAVALAVSFVFDVIVTVVAFVVALAGSFPEFFVHFSHVYPVVAVASIFTVFPYLYVFASVVLVPSLLTADIPVPFANVNVYVNLLNHIKYEVFAVSFGDATNVAALVLYVVDAPLKFEAFVPVGTVPYILAGVIVVSFGA